MLKLLENSLGVEWTGLNKEDDTQVVEARASAKKMLDFAVKKGKAQAVLSLLLEVFKKDRK